MTTDAPAEPAPPLAPDRLFTRGELQRMIGRSSETFRRWIKAGKIPPPDVAPTRETQQWRRSTLHAAGIKV